MKMYSMGMANLQTDKMIKVWVALVRAQHSVMKHVETALKQAGFPPLDWYDVLLELNRNPDEGLRSIEIEKRTLLPQHGISRLLDKLENHGYIERRLCENDGRGRQIYISSGGQKLLTLMWPVYKSALEDAIGDHLTSEQAANLADLLPKLYHSDE